MHQIVPLSSVATAKERRRWRLAVAGMLLTVLLFGLNFSLSRYAILNGLTQHDLLALRFGTAGLLLLPIFLRPGLASCGGVGWKRGFWLAVTSGVPMTYLMVTGLTMAPAAHGATIGPGTVTLIGIAGSVVLFGAVLSRRLIAGVVTVVAGLACLAIAGGSGTGESTLRGDLCFFVVGVLWGFYPLLVQLWKVDGLKAAAIVSVLSMAYLPFYALFYFRGFDIAPWWVLGLNALFQGVLNIIVGLWIWGWASHVLGAAVVGRFPPLIPVAGTLLAIPILGEIPGPVQLVGFVLIIGGLFIASWRRPTRQPREGEAPAHAERQADTERRP